MNNNDKYDLSFTKTFGIIKKKLPKLKYRDIKEWDSVGHMNLISTIEEKFDIQMQIDDIIDFSSFKKGKAILKKYKVKIK
ncbi:acyl carrier protein [Candidatus Pelagibacter sp.]|nr:acyl carrier protein [Candidatus Pelagibacter sp.]